MDVESYKRIISGQRRDVVAMLLRPILRGCSVVYGVVAKLRNLSFDVGLRRSRQIDVPVISIGNLTTGGTGKTPLVATVVRTLQEIGRRPGIVSRGYKADQSGGNDEKQVLDRLCPGVPHVQSPDRIFASRKLLGEQSVDVIVLDDAFQHRKIHRDLDIAVFDATNPFGFGYVLPRGLLREYLSGLKRSQLAIVTRAGSVSDPERKKIDNVIAKCNPSLSSRTLHCDFQPTMLLSVDGDRADLNTVDGMDVAVMTAIGNPEAFLETCRSFGARVVVTRFFPDHHHFTQDELQSVVSDAKSAGATIVLTTLKDLVKISRQFTQFHAVEIETRFSPKDADQQLRQLILSAIKD